MIVEQIGDLVVGIALVVVTSLVGVIGYYERRWRRNKTEQIKELHGEIQSIEAGDQKKIAELERDLQKRDEKIRDQEEELNKIFRNESSVLNEISDSLDTIHSEQQEFQEEVRGFQREQRNKLSKIESKIERLRIRVSSLENFQGDEYDSPVE